MPLNAWTEGQIIANFTWVLGISLPPVLTINGANEGNHILPRHRDQNRSPDALAPPLLAIDLPSPSIADADPVAAMLITPRRCWRSVDGIPADARHRLPCPQPCSTLSAGPFFRPPDYALMDWAAILLFVFDAANTATTCWRTSGARRR